MAQSRGRGEKTKAKARGLTIIHAPIAREPDPWTPETMLGEFLDKVKSGEIAATKGAMIFYLAPTPDGLMLPHYWSTGLTQPEIVAFCELAKRMALDDWRGK